MSDGIKARTRSPDPDNVAEFGHEHWLYQKRDEEGDYVAIENAMDVVGRQLAFMKRAVENPEIIAAVEAVLAEPEGERWLA